MKKIIVESCDECPYRRRDKCICPLFEIGEYETVPKNLRIPKWCPLPEDSGK